MNKMKKALATIVVLAGITGYAWLEYTWSDSIKPVIGENWTILLERKADWEVIKPWSWVKRPVNNITIVEDRVVLKLNDSCYAAHTWHYEQGEEDYHVMTIIDLKNKKAAHSSMEDFTNRVLYEQDKFKDLFWVDYTKGSYFATLSIYIKEKGEIELYEPWQ